MPRVFTIEKSRKEHECRKCSATIPKGEGYRHWSFRYGGKVIRCMNCPPPRASELTQSGVKSTLYAAQESFDDQIGQLDRTEVDSFRDSVVQLLNDAESEADGARDECQDALDQWEHGNEMLQERVDAVEAWIDTLSNAASEIEGFEAEEMDCPECEGNTGGQCQQCCGEGQVPNIEGACETIEGLANDAIYELEM